MSEISKKIKSKLKKFQKLKAIDRHYMSLLEQEDELIAKRDKMEVQLAKELKDVERLEGMGVKSIFYNILGNKTSQLEKERQEYLELSHKHTQHLKSIKLIRFEKELIDEKRSGLDTLATEIERLKLMREEEIMATPSSLRNELIDINKKNDEHINRISLLQETTKKAKAAKMSLERVIQHFRKAKDWGDWDMVGRSNRNSGYFKHNAINNAVDESNRSNILLQSLSKDLEKAGYIAGNLSFRFQSFTGFMDILFDNLITDWIIQGKIKNALSQTVAIRDKVEILIDSMIDEINGLNNTMDDLELKRQSILER